MVLLLAFDPFLQALVSLRGELQTARDPLTAFMPRSNKMDPGDTVWLSDSIRDSAVPDYAMSSAISSGAFFPDTLVKHPLMVNCPTGNCTWSDFASIDICLSCKDVSPFINTTPLIEARPVEGSDGEQDRRVLNTTTFNVAYGNLEMTNAPQYRYGDDDINMSMNATTEKRSTYNFRDHDTFLLSLMFLKGPKGLDCSRPCRGECIKMFRSH